MNYLSNPDIIDAQSQGSSNTLLPVTELKHFDTTFRNALYVIRKYLPSSLVVFFVVIILTLLLNYSLVPRYVSSATIRIDTNPQQILDYGVNIEAQPTLISDPIFLETQYKLLRSRKLATSVVTALDLDTEQLMLSTFQPFMHRLLAPVGALKRHVMFVFGIDPPEASRQRPEEILLQYLAIKPIKYSQLIEVDYKSDDPELSAQIVNQFIDSFISYRDNSRRTSAEKAEQFLRVELINARQKLQDSESALLDYAKERNIISIGANKSILKNNLEALSTAYINAKEQRIITESIYSKKHNVSGALQVTNSVLIGTLKTQLADLLAKFQHDLEVYKPGYPKMLSLQAQINDVKTQIRKETKIINTTTNNDLKTSFKSALQTERKLGEQIKDYETRLLSFEAKNLHYVNLQRETDTNRALYEGLLQRLKEVGVASGSASESIEIIDAAITPLKSYSPSKGGNLMLGTMLGLMLSLLSAFVRNFLNHTISSIEELERLNIPYPVLTTLPKVRGDDVKNLPVLAVKKPTSPFAESISYLYSNLANCQYGVPKVLHITSALPAEGKSSVVTNFATLLVKSGKKVIIIDADLRRPTIHKSLHINNEIGLSNYLVGDAPSIPLQKVPSKYDLFVIPAGPAVKDPFSLLSSQIMINLCNELRNSFDQIIIDSPPVLGLADSLVLANRADATLFVISSNRSSEDDLHNAIRNLEKGFANLVGLIFTQERQHSTQYYNSFDYSDGRQALVQE